MIIRLLKNVSLVAVLSCVLAFGGYALGVYGSTNVYKALKEKQQVFSTYFSSLQQSLKEGTYRSLPTNDPAQKGASMETLHELMAKIAICR